MAIERPDAQGDRRQIMLSWERVDELAAVMMSTISRVTGLSSPRVYGIPRGGIFAAQALKASNRDVQLVIKPEDADVLVDDIYDSGATAAQWRKKTGYRLPFMVLVDKEDSEWENKWVVFPWETMTGEQGPEDNVRRIIEYIGEDPGREGLRDTPARVVRSWSKLFGGYQKDPKELVTVFERDSSDEMVVLKDVEFYSTCEHHLLPFFGRAHVAYIPNGKVIGVSKLARIIECYARRLQIQERICQQVTEFLMQELKPLGAACLLEAQHFCMTSRGVEKQNSIMVTSSLAGVFKEKRGVKEEFLAIVRE